MPHTPEDLERFLTTFYAYKDCPFVLGQDAIVPLSCTREVVALMSLPQRRNDWRDRLCNGLAALVRGGDPPLIRDPRSS